MPTLRLHHLRAASAIFQPRDRYAIHRGILGRYRPPIGSVDYYLVGEEVGGVRRDYPSPLKLLTVRNPSGYDIFFDRLRLADGTVSRNRFADGTYIIRIKSQFYQQGEYPVHLPESAVSQSIDLEPSYAYPFPTATLKHINAPTLLRGTLHATDGAGVDGVAIEAVGKSNRYMTDKTGQWVLVFEDGQASEDVTVHFRWPDGTEEDVPSVPVSKGRESALKQAGLRGWVRNAAGIGIPGARITAENHPGNAVSAQDGSWFYYFGVNQADALANVSATLPDGRVETLSDIQVKQRAVVTVPTFTFA